MSRLATLACVGCGAAIRRRAGGWGFCKACSNLAYGFLEREMTGQHIDARFRARNRVMSMRGVFRAVIRLERSLAGVA